MTSSKCEILFLRLWSSVQSEDKEHEVAFKLLFLTNNLAVSREEKVYFIVFEIYSLFQWYIANKLYYLQIY